MSHNQHISNTTSNKQGDSNTASSSPDILLGPRAPMITDDTKWNNQMETLLLDNSLHTILALPDNDDEDEVSSIEQQLSALEKESNNFFETLGGMTELPLPKEEQEGSGQHDGSSTTVSYMNAEQDTTLHYDECCDHISLGTNGSTISSKSEQGKRIHTSSVSTDHDLSSETEEGISKLYPTNLPSKIFHFGDATKSAHEYNHEKTTSPHLDSVRVHSFVKEYETRANDLRACMKRTKSSRSKVAKVQQYLKKRYLQNCSSIRRSNEVKRKIGQALRENAPRLRKERMQRVKTTKTQLEKRNSSSEYLMPSNCIPSHHYPTRNKSLQYDMIKVALLEDTATKQEAHTQSNTTSTNSIEFTHNLLNGVSDMHIWDHESNFDEKPASINAVTKPDGKNSFSRRTAAIRLYGNNQKTEPIKNFDEKPFDASNHESNFDEKTASINAVTKPDGKNSFSRRTAAIRLYGNNQKTEPIKNFDEKPFDA